MKFDISSMHIIFEASSSSSQPKSGSPIVNQTIDASSSPDAVNDTTGANLDNSLAQSDLNKVFDDICPITGQVFAAMKNAASDPKNLKIAAVKSGNGERADLFIEAVEFATFCEACNCTVGEAIDKIIESYTDSQDVPELDNADFHVVFPSDSLNKNILGGENLGRDIKNDWAMQLMRGCRRYGLKVNAGVEIKPTEESESIKEAFFTSTNSDKKLLEKCDEVIENYASEHGFIITVYTAEWRSRKDPIKKGDEIEFEIAGIKNSELRSCVESLNAGSKDMVKEINKNKESGTIALKDIKFSANSSGLRHATIKGILVF